MSKPVVVLVMSEMCGACQNFKNKILPDLERELKNDPRLDLVILDFPVLGIPNKYEKYFHPEMKNGFIEFFPTVLMFPGNLWGNPSSKLKGVAKHTMSKNVQPDFSKASILSWVDETLKRNPLFSHSNRFSESDLTKKIDNDRYIVPTYGTYNRFHPTKPDDEEI